MTWKFTLIHDGAETVIEEPINWDSITKTIKRDLQTHGAFFDFTDDLQFVDIAYWLLKEEYLLKRIDGDVMLRVEWLCSDCDDFQFFYEGKLDFSTYHEICGETCSIKCSLDASEAELLVGNRFDTAVDLTSDKAFDTVTVLPSYPYLNKPIEIPGKVILIQSKAVNDKTLVSKNLRNDPEWGHISDQNSARAQIYPGFIKTIVSDLSDTSFQESIKLLRGGANNRPSTGQIPVIDFKEFSSLPCSTSDAVIKYRYKGVITTSGGHPGAIFKIFKLPKGSATDSFDYLPLASFPLGNSGVPFDFQQTLNITLNVGDKIYCYIFTNVQFPSDFTSYILTEDPECFFDISLHSLCPETPAKTFFIHEAGSRIIESITNGAYRFKSAYYGRTDSMPYAFPADGCGSLRAVTNGLQIRRAVLADNSSPKVFLSFKDFFESLSAIDAVGFGVEGNDIRVEPLEYFYTDDIIFTADGVNEIETTVRREWTYNQFNFGYDKFETESTNGLDAMHTKREYRVLLRNTKNKFEQLSKLIADGYAIEVTRRKYGVSEDWRYDQNPFIICCKRGDMAGFLVSYVNTGIGFYSLQSAPNWAVVGAVLHIIAEETDGLGNAPIPANTGDYTITSISLTSGYLFLETTPGFAEFRLFAGAKITSDLLTDVEVDQGNISTPSNIFDPATVLNYSITPIRNALKWFRWVIQGVANYNNAKIAFNKGDGNYVAKGKLNNGCIVEAEAIAENEDVDISTFVDPDAAKPFPVPEKDSFKFPMGLNEFVEVASKKYGKIQYRKLSTDEWKYGWIESLTHNPNDGDATFNLIKCR